MSRFVVVTFIASNEVSVLPENWLVSKNRCYWPKSTAVTALVKQAVPPKDNWMTLKIKIFTKKNGQIRYYDNYYAAEEKVDVALQTSDLSSQSSLEEELMNSSAVTSSPPEIMDFIINMENEVEGTLEDGMNATLTPMLQSPQDLTQTTHETELEQDCGGGCYRILKKEVLPVLNRLVDIVTILEADNKKLQAFIIDQNMVGFERTQPHPDLPQLPAKTLDEFLLLEEYSKIPQKANALVKYLSGIGGLHVGNATRRVWAALVTDQVSNQLSWIGANNKYKLQGLNVNRIVIASVKRIISTATEMDVLVATKQFLDWKYSTKSKYRKMQSHCTQTGSGPASKLILNTLEERGLSVWGKVAVAGASSVTLYEGIPINTTAESNLTTAEENIEIENNNELIEQAEFIYLERTEESTTTPNKSFRKPKRNISSFLGVNHGCTARRKKHFSFDRPRGANVIHILCKLKLAFFVMGRVTYLVLYSVVHIPAVVIVCLMIMGDYEKEQARIQTLLNEILSDDEPYQDSSESYNPSDLSDVSTNSYSVTARKRQKVFTTESIDKNENHLQKIGDSVDGLDNDQSNLKYVEETPDDHIDIQNAIIELDDDVTTCKRAKSNVTSVNQIENLDTARKKFNNVSDILFGTINIENGQHPIENLRKVARAIRNPCYQPYGGYFNDIGLVELTEPLEYNLFVQPINLPYQSAFTPVGQSATLVGWGYPIDNGEVLNQLHKVNIFVYSNAVCKMIHGINFTAQVHICAGVPEGGKGQCTGDSGGPLAVDRQQIGIVSWSVKPCAQKGYPGVFTKVSRYIHWINKFIYT
ncbi:hypothetical protein RN001_010092 [Aquatica leii]|uniref:Peptidase S1 domain-containing protein n=1 Tax=Aquatica leii TaxID=1421715 RepID=A0AAN7P8X6_9COLE|nr:hypothetical protein RN001_010092 [Aquatica leii]